LCAKFVPHSLTLEQWENRVTSCQNIIKKADAKKFSITSLRDRIPGVKPLTRNKATYF